MSVSLCTATMHRLPDDLLDSLVPATRNSVFAIRTLLFSVIVSAIDVSKRESKRCNSSQMARHVISQALLYFFLKLLKKWRSAYGWSTTEYLIDIIWILLGNQRIGDDFVRLTDFIWQLIMRKINNFACFSIFPLNGNFIYQIQLLFW